LPEDVSPVIELQEEITVGNVTLAKGAQVDNVYQSLPDGSVTAPVYQLSYNTKFSDEQARQIGEALESAGITDYFIDQDNGTIETEYLDSSLVGKDYGQIFTKINEHATRFEEAARKIYDIIPTADYVTSKSVGIRRVRVQDSTLQRAEQAQGDIQEVSKTEKLSEINQELNKIREETPDQFRKDGMPKKN